MAISWEADSISENPVQLSRNTFLVFQNIIIRKKDIPIDTSDPSWLQIAVTIRNLDRGDQDSKMTKSLSRLSDAA